MKLINYHTHSAFSDGADSMEEMVLAAIELGFSELGMSDHSFTGFDPDYCMAYDAYESYRQEVKRLNSLYGDRIRLFCGIEQDSFSDHPAEGFDYIIGSVHYVRIGDEYIAADFSGEKGTKLLVSAAERLCHGDIYTLLELFYEEAACVVEKTGADIIGHFDVISKTNEEYPFFDPSHPRYVAAWKKAADRLLTYQKPFEINISQVLRGTRREPYPSDEIRRYLSENGASFLYTGDCHSTDSLRRFADWIRANADPAILQFTKMP